MYTVEEIKNKVKTGTWTKEDVARCVEELKQISDFTVYTEEIYYISYGIFAYNFREYAYPLIKSGRLEFTWSVLVRNPDFILPW